MPFISIYEYNNSVKWVLAFNEKKKLLHLDPNKGDTIK